MRENFLSRTVIETTEQSNNTRSSIVKMRGKFVCKILEKKTPWEYYVCVSWRGWWKEERWQAIGCRYSKTSWIKSRRFVQHSYDPMSGRSFQKSKDGTLCLLIDKKNQPNDFQEQKNFRTQVELCRISCRNDLYFLAFIYALYKFYPICILEQVGLTHKH